jgi:hypothetical protein
MKISKARKAVGVGIVGVYGWWGLIITSAAAHISAGEWYALGGVAVAVATAYGLTNASEATGQV